MNTRKIPAAGFAAAAAAAAVLGFVAAAAAPVTAQAQSYPDKPISYVIPFGPGGESDIAARHQKEFFKPMFGQDLVISYKPGGGGAVGWSQLNNMEADGYTIMGINLPHIIIKPRQKNVGFTTENVAGIYLFHYTPDALAVKTDSPFKTLQDYIDYAKANPDKLILSGSGKGTANHLAQVRFDRFARIKTTYVGFKGTGKAIAALLDGEVKAQWGYTSAGATHEDEIRLLAVAMEKRHPRFPDVPTFKELGYDLVSGAYRGIAVPAGTPEPVRRKLSNIISEINAIPAFRKKMENDGMALLDVDYNAMPAFIEKMTDVYIDTAKDAGLLK